MAQQSWWLFHDFTLLQKNTFATHISGSRTVALERVWISIWNCWLRDRSNSNFWSCYHNAFPMRIKTGCEILPVLSLLSSFQCLHFLSSEPGSAAFVENPRLGLCVPYITFTSHIMRLRRVNSSAWIMQTWWTINLSPWTWSCWYFSLLGNSLRNIKPSFFEVSPNYFFRREKKNIMSPKETCNHEQ